MRYFIPAPTFLLRTTAAIVVMFCLALLPANPVGAQDASCTAPGGVEGVEVSIPINGETCVAVGDENLQNNALFRYLVVFIQFLSIGVGFAVVGGIITGAYMYITARANASQVEKGKNWIINSIVGLLMYIFMYAILNFVIPGGIL